MRCKHCGELASDRAFRARGGGRDSCPECGEPKTKGYPRCIKCKGIAQRGDANPFYKGGKTLHRAGYIFVLDPRPNPKHRYVAQHRFLWEEANGPIPAGYIIHHLNGDKMDNRLENLTPLSNSAHRKMHADIDGERSAYIQKLEARIRELEAPP